MSITSGLFIVASMIISCFFFFSSLSMNWISSAQKFTIDELPFVIAVEKNNNSEDFSIKSDHEQEIEKEKTDKKSKRKQWQFTDTPQEFIGQPKQQQMGEMKSTLEQSSSAVKGTAESSTMLKIYLNQQNK